MNQDILCQLDKEKNNAKQIIALLNKIGKIDTYEKMDYQRLFALLEYKNRDVRQEVVKNLGKFNCDEVQAILISHYNSESDSLVKRECISSIGRQRNPKNIDFLIQVLTNSDPKIVLQAIRALLIFKDNSNVQEVLMGMFNHPNEMIQDVLSIEFSLKKTNKQEPHSYVNPHFKNLVVNGDVLNILQQIKEEIFHLTFTSPPYYNARDYSFYSSYQEYLDFLRNVFREVYRLTKDGRFLIVNTSPIIIPRVSRKHSSKRYPIPFDIHNFLVQDGWEFIDDIIWKKPESSVKNRIGGFLQHRKPLAYKPNCITEYVMVYRKKSNHLIDWNIKQYDFDIVKESLVLDDFDTSNVWNIDPSFDKTHSAIFPKELCEKVIKYYSYKNDLVFDPFGGSGTFGQVALQNNRNCFLTEINFEYYERIKEKLSKSSKKITYLSNEEFKEWISPGN